METCTFLCFHVTINFRKHKNTYVFMYFFPFSASHYIMLKGLLHIMARKRQYSLFINVPSHQSCTHCHCPRYCRVEKGYMHIIISKWLGDLGPTYILTSAKLVGSVTLAYHTSACSRIQVHIVPSSTPLNFCGYVRVRGGGGYMYCLHNSILMTSHRHIYIHLRIVTLMYVHRVKEHASKAWSGEGYTDSHPSEEYLCAIFLPVDSGHLGTRRYRLANGSTMDQVLQGSTCRVTSLCTQELTKAGDYECLFHVSP